MQTQLFVILLLLLLSSGALAETSADEYVRIRTELAETKQQIARISSQLSALQSLLGNASKNTNHSTLSLTTGGQAVPYEPIYCPPGQVPVGLKAWGSPTTTRYCVGCLTGVSLLCQPLGQQ